MQDISPSSGLPVVTRGSLVLSAFTTALAFSIILPNLPARIAAASGLGDAGAISRHTGLMTAAYTAAIFVAAPCFGRASDIWGRRPVLVMGLAGFSGNLVLFEATSDLLVLYLTRVGAGLCAAAVTPVVLATIGDWSPDESWRARRFAWIGAATMIGFMIGPLLGGALPMIISPLVRSDAPFALLWPTLLGLISAGWIAFSVPPKSSRTAHLAADNGQDHRETRGISNQLLVLAAIVSGAVAAFDVTLALRGNFVAEGTSYAIGLLLAECSAVMLVCQVLVFSPLIEPQATRWLIAPALGVLALALAVAPFINSVAELAVAVGAIAAAAGMAAPIITYWTALVAGRHQGEDLGRWTAVTSLGQSVGSAAAGLFLSQEMSGGIFALLSSAALGGMIMATRIPKILAARMASKSDQ
ncbi:hypothetical protein ES707_10791 [subsurface metagenome]